MNLKAELRTTTGTSASRKARQEGKIPVAMYSKGEETQSNWPSWIRKYLEKRRC